MWYLILMVKRSSSYGSGTDETFTNDKPCPLASDPSGIGKYGVCLERMGVRPIRTPPPCTVQGPTTASSAGR